MFSSNSDNFKIRADNKTDSTTTASNETSGVKPKKAVNARKEFKEVLGEKKENLEDESMISDNNEIKETPLMSLFSQPKAGKEEARLKDFLDETAPTLKEKPSVNIQTQKIEKSLSQDLKSLESIVESSTDKVESSTDELDRLAKKGKFNSQFTTPQPDLAAIIPNVTNNDSSSINLSIANKVEQTIPNVSPIHDIVVDLIDKLMIVKTAGQTDTVVTLNMPGIFKGAIVVISEFNTANGQLNLAFENLKNEAKILLDSLPNREALTQVLIKEGYIVQQFTTTTIIEHPPIVSDQPTAEKERKGESQEKNKQEKSK